MILVLNQLKTQLFPDYKIKKKLQGLRHVQKQPFADVLKIS